ncbi:tumor necrosis factor receptor superfamily member 5 [Plectropomus leopardus]|uniref:tumor necrosis factor receptor superfamily member 5 n=1 Tax=Plectropomus leopardus TaxID=160734 RepID=UPI001C4ACA7D|nr:tumor necrosis factor receptor superfamily member 5 [Plectropomus leopardus]
MQPLCAFTFLCTLSLFSPVLSLNCSGTQYPWPIETPRLCCDMCPPGQFIERRSDNTCDHRCKPCEGNRFIENYNEELTCEVCDNCDKPNMVYKSNCSTTRNTVCGCKAGYRCGDKPCTHCVLTQTSVIRSTLPPSTTAPKPEPLTTLWQPSQPLRDTVWFLVIIALLCAGIALVVATKIKPFLRWIKSKHGYFLTEETEPSPRYSENEEVSTPVQEGLGKCDQCDV